MDKDLVYAHFVELLHDVLRVLRPVINIDLPWSHHLLLVHLTPKAPTSCAAWGEGPILIAERERERPLGMSVDW